MYYLNDEVFTHMCEAFLAGTLYTKLASLLKSVWAEDLHKKAQRKIARMLGRK